MVLHPLASFVLRPRRGMILLAAAMLMSTSLGCSQRRSAMRPIFRSPRTRVLRPVLIPNNCPSGNCGGTTIGSSQTTIETAPTILPAAPGSSTFESATPSLDAPVSPRIDEPVKPAGISPPRPNAVPEEPTLELTPANEAPPTASPGPSSSLAPNRNTPSTSQGTGRRSLFGRPREASLRERLRPFVNDPDDLFTPPKADRPWKYVVMHHSAHASGGLNEIDREHRKVLGWEGCGYHFVIGNGTGSPDGQVEVAQRWSNQKHGVHCRDGKTSEVNEYGIGICLVGDLDSAGPTPRQIEASKALIDYLGDRYQITGDRIGTHATLAASPTACPGKHFPVQAILGSRNYAQR
ncbi:N-acetylmuramoyl-L-alanine amidase [Singulisphaera sp. GP187]|uniref:N-acetylmuramoyl-L-alanine amidase n=1 Tax=Singulisphaera sp. GP187 TaxID=1882752 RepID=UPI0009282529|nr:N-acetylmuramoyl-L-alanine amidase [Singulisphaera sp. GP187]SIO59493.1 N-acetylmuramoyl-L-alanine amidase [Singulisphaera sp. GP187]